MSLLPQTKEQHGMDLSSSRNNIIFRASDLRFITIAAVLDHAALLIQKLRQ